LAGVACGVLAVVATVFPGAAAVGVLPCVVGSSGISGLASSVSPGFNNEACSMVLLIYGIEIKVKIVMF
jgi:hypothetical protein